GEEDLHAILNMSDNPLEVEIPQFPDRLWHLAVDTAQAPPHDIIEPARQVQWSGQSYRVTPRSVVVLEARSRVRAPAR
ncbi:MAG TPA: hypothetical protein VKB20_09310, partial [Steroidobacteraceae bacterium]|nr:hypothetical protein [Steroidobacteraceae bacterium]